MSDSVRDLLVHGVAAARANVQDEARNYLEWVLSRADATLDQQAEAWYWLSEITSDPKEKREQLENVLAINPRNASARRSLAIIDGKLRPEDIIDHSSPSHALGATETAVTVRRYTCPQCGGKTAFDMAQKALQCTFCGTKLNEMHLEKQVVELDFSATLPTAGAHRWELPTERALACAGCGATVTLPPGQRSAECLFCGSAHVAIVATRRDLLQPWGMIPFAFDQRRALDRIRRWVQEQAFLPATLYRQASLEQPRPVYLPYWTFDIVVELGWKGVMPESGLAVIEQATVFGGITGMARPSKPVKMTTDGVHIEILDDVMVPGTRHLPVAMLEEIADFNTKALTPYSPDFLAAWPAEIYHVSLADASIEAHSHARSIAIYKARRSPEVLDLQNLTFRGGGVTIDSFKLTLLPVWVGALLFDGERFPIVVNGQTGSAAGHLPRNRFQNVMNRIFG